MEPFTVKYYRQNASYSPDAFFILARGTNTGRPSFHSNPNCFVFSCSFHDRERYYWIVHALWSMGQFKPHLKGTPIQFITIKDLQSLIHSAARSMKEIEKELPTLRKLLKTEAKLKKQLSQIQTGRDMLIRRLVSRTAS